MQIQAIQTEYKGYRFRSRLEARWAVFFDALDIEWEYESEGYDLGSAGWYLPDFRLTATNIFAEIKPKVEISSIEKNKHTVFSKSGIAKHFYVLYGPPVTFHDDDRATRFDDYLTQMIFCARILFESESQDIKYLQAAAKMARSARFEHGEKGYVKEKGQT